MSAIEPQMEVLFALAELKRKDSAAYDALLKKLNVERWSQIRENDYGPVIMECKAKTGEATITDSEVVAEMSGGNAEDNATLRAVYEKAYGKAPPVKDLAAHATGSTTRERIQSMAEFDQHARRVAHSAKAEGNGG